jgi:hypothetical protein
LSNKDKLEEDFKKLNQDIEHAVEKEMKRLIEEINVLREKANKMSEELSSPSSDE